MKLTVLADNNTYIDRYYLGEPAVSYYIEDGDCRLLFDAGYSDVFMRNAEKMGIDLSRLTDVVFSHGHNDHTGGFPFLAEKHDLSDVTLTAHPACFGEKYDGGEYIGAPFGRDEAASLCRLRCSKDSVMITDNIMFLGEIPESNDFETRRPGTDPVPDDTALALNTGNGLFIVTGCSHSGICNITERAAELWGESRVAGILGGFHMFEKSRRLEKTIEYFRKRNVRALYPCHCVSFPVKAAMHEALGVREVGSGMALEF